MVGAQLSATINAIIYPPTQDYKYLMQRPQHLMKAFASAGITVFYLNPVSSLLNDPGLLHPNLYVLNRPHLDLNLAKSSSVFYFSFPPHVYQCQHYPHSLVVFDSIDAPVEAFKAWSYGYVEALSRADLVVASSERLLAESRKYNENVILVPNGCDFELFNPAAERNLIVPPEVRDITAPIIGYYGSISSWFDVELIEQVADTFSHCQVVIIGPGSDKLNRSGRHNILSLGYKPYLDLPHYAQLFDVALIPFRVSPLTEAVNPVKMWEYLAAGLPVVSSALPEVRGITEVYCSESKADFIDNIAKALYEDTEGMKRERIELARKNTWMTRAEAILGAIQITANRKLTMNTHLSKPSGYPDYTAGNGRFRSMTVKNVVINQGGRDRVLKYRN